MNNSDERIKKLAALLEKNNPALIEQAIQLLREEQPFKGAVELLAYCYDRNQGVMVNRAIESFMNDLKDKSLRSEVINEIKNDHAQKTVTMLVSSCWQSGLDYSAFTYDLAEIFIRSDYGTALECFTVIEESIPLLTGNEKNRIAELLNENAGVETGAKKALALDLISSLKA